MENKNIIIGILIILDLFFIILINLQLISSITSPQNQTNKNGYINFEGYFNQETKEKIYSLVNNIEEGYFHNTKQINFFSLKEKYSQYCPKNSIGCNILSIKNGTKEFTVNVYYTETGKEITLCHELLHNRIREEVSHPLVYKLGKEGVCYKNYTR